MNGYEYYQSFADSAAYGQATVWSLSISVISVIALWMLFQKANEPGWAAIVPFYNAYVLFKITWGS